jgi:hypothetical protein
VKGHQHVIDMRMDKLKPRCVFVWVDSNPPPAWQENPQEFQPGPDIYVAPGEPIGALDFRCCVGLTVSVAARSLPRMAEAVAAIKRAGAAHVMSAVMTDRDEVIFMSNNEGAAWAKQTG